MEYNRILLEETHRLNVLKHILYRHIVPAELIGRTSFFLSLEKVSLY